MLPFVKRLNSQLGVPPWGHSSSLCAQIVPKRIAKTRGLVSGKMVVHCLLDRGNAATRRGRTFQMSLASLPKTVMRMERYVMAFKMQGASVRMGSVSFTNLKTVFSNSLILAGCGVMGAFFFTACKTCDKEDCEDEGACWWEDGKGCKEQKKTTLKPEIVENVGGNIEWLNGNKTVSTQSARNGGQSVLTQTFALFLICGLMAV